MKLAVIGDVHGKLREYQKIVEKYSHSICVGDFGFQYEWDWHRVNVSTHHHINPGNHDFGPYMADKSRSLGNYSHFPEGNIFTVRGAFSIDRIYRVAGIDWFENEELTYQEGLECFDEYVQIKPEIVISHDCPESIRQTFFGIFEKSNTSNLLQAMFREHRPKLWIFGHHHKHRDSNIFGTRFICLEELKTFEIEI